MNEGTVIRSIGGEKSPFKAAETNKKAVVDFSLCRK